MEPTGKGTNFQFIRDTVAASGTRTTLIARLDVNMADDHVAKSGPHLNLETLVNGVKLHPEKWNDIDPMTVPQGDYP